MADMEENEFRVPDKIDQATRVEQMEREHQLGKALNASRPEKWEVDGKVVTQEPDENGNYPITDCVDCEDEIPKERLALGRIRCVLCQTIKEKKA